MLIREIKYVTDESLNVCDLSISMLTNTLKNIQNLILRSNSISSCNTLTVNNSRKNSNHLSPGSNSNRLSINGTLTPKSANSFTLPNTLSKGFLYKTNTNGILNSNQNTDFHTDNFMNQYMNTNEVIRDSNSYSADEDEENKLTAYEHSNKHKLRKSLPSQIIRRLPPQHPPVWSTTTSATGLPIVEPMPSRQRSLSLKGPTFSNSPLFEFKSQKPSETLYSIQSQKLENNQVKLKTMSQALKIDNEEIDTTLDRSYDEDEDETNNTTTMNINISPNQNKITSDYDSGESPNSSDYNSDTDKLHLQVKISF